MLFHDCTVKDTTFATYWLELGELGTHTYLILCFVTKKPSTLSLIWLIFPIISINILKRAVLEICSICYVRGNYWLTHFKWRNVLQIYEEVDIVLTQLLTEHGFLRSYFVERGILAGSPNYLACENAVEDVEHVLFRCPRFNWARIEMQQQCRSLFYYLFS